MPAVNNRARNAAAKSEVETARKAGTLVKVPSETNDIAIDADGVKFVVTACYRDNSGKLQTRVNGSGVLAYVGNKRSAAKCWTGAILAQFSEHADDIREACANLDSTFLLGEHRPAAEKPVAKAAAKADIADVIAAMDADQLAKLKALLAS